LISRSFIPLAERKTIKYFIDIPEEKLICFFDRDKIEKIMVNLLSNAFKYTPENGDIKVSVHCSEETGKKDTRLVELTVSDTGVGMSTVQLGTIFDRFYQVEDGWKKETGGTGIGLSLTKELTDLQHGEIRVESEPQKGSIFRVKLPVGKDHLERNEYIISEPQESDGESMIIKYSLSLDHKPENAMVSETVQGSDRPVILIADDNSDIRHHIRESLSGEFIVKEAENGRDALEKAILYIPDLLITDLMMPEMNGLELCGKLKTDIRISHIPVIMLTAKAEIQHKLEGLETGADDYIVKPFNNKELCLRVKNLIDQRRKLRAKYSKDVLLDAGEKTVKSMDDKFLERVRKIIEKNISDSSFDVNSFYPEMGMSRMQLFRKLKALVNQTPGELIRNLRLQRAALLLKQNYGNIAEVTFEVGFNNLSYFSNCFKE
jgi:DNA-binding response OmpR family regulator